MNAKDRREWESELERLEQVAINACDAASKASARLATARSVAKQAAEARDAAQSEMWHASQTLAKHKARPAAMRLPADIADRLRGGALDRETWVALSRRGLARRVTRYGRYELTDAGRHVLSILMGSA